MLEMGVLPALLSCWSPGVRRVRTCDDDDGDSCHTHLSRTRGEDKSSTACDDDGADDSCAAPREDDDDEDSAAAVWQLERAALITMHDILASAPSASRAPDTQSKLVEVLRQLVLTATVTDVQYWTLAVLQTLRGEWGVLSQLQTPDIAAALAAWAGAHAGSPLLHRAALESLVTLCEGGTSGIAAGTSSGVGGGVNMAGSRGAVSASVARGGSSVGVGVGDVGYGNDYGAVGGAEWAGAGALGRAVDDGVLLSTVAALHSDDSDLVYWAVRLLHAALAHPSATDRVRHAAAPLHRALQAALSSSPAHVQSIVLSVVGRLSAGDSEFRAGLLTQSTVGRLATCAG
jgi:hypothetical protein